MDRVWQGAALRKLRMLAGKSIAEAAARCEIGQSAVSQWELGISNPKREHLERLAELYEMPLELLLYEIGYELRNPPSLRQWYRGRAAAAAAAPEAAEGVTRDDMRRNGPTSSGESGRHTRVSGRADPAPNGGTGSSAAATAVLDR